ncbi:response regulator transcription factor [Actinomadura soli]|uniref:Response regulator transcription factor n=1 Tax=Actinomadura soli TaxID=2508997 RepID=A0A5C4J0Y8_9ACTN|nr:response regulator transcription factor [Actinomadura soli]TMQ90345.1 response regulator transcription factor [Actinomadura soli]
MRTRPKVIGVHTRESATRILLADDHALVRRGLRLILDAEPDLTVVAEAADGAEAIDASAGGDVDLAILDIAMPRMTGLQAAREISRAVRSAMRDEPFLYPAAVTALIREYLARDRDGDAPDSVLTPREEEIIKLVAEGYLSKRIAETLTISVKTVDRHRANILGKLGMRDRLELTKYAIRVGLVEP